MHENKSYDLYYMDGDVRSKVPENEMRKPTKRQLNDKLVGKRFFDEGDVKGKARFKKGEFTVLIRGVVSHGSEPHYYCERDTTLQMDRDIQSFGLNYITKLIALYDDE